MFKILFKTDCNLGVISKGVGIRNLETVSGRDSATHTTGTIETGTGASIAQHQPVRLKISCNSEVIIMQPCDATVPHIAGGNHQVWSNRQFHQSVEPVAVIIGGCEILHFVAQGKAPVNLPFGLHDEDVGIDATALPFDYRLIVHLVHVHEILCHCLRPFLLYLQIHIMLICLTHSEKRGG